MHIKGIKLQENPAIAETIEAEIRTQLLSTQTPEKEEEVKETAKSKAKAKGEDAEKTAES